MFLLLRYIVKTMFVLTLKKWYDVNLRFNLKTFYYEQF